MRKLIFFGFLSLVCVIGWQVGQRVTSDAAMLLIGFLFASMGFSCAFLIAVAAPRPVDVQPQPMMMIAQPPQYRIVESDVLVLPVATRGRLEVR